MNCCPGSTDCREKITRDTEREKSVQSFEEPCLKLDTTECRGGKFKLASLQKERLCFYSNPTFWTADPEGPEMTFPPGVVKTDRLTKLKSRNLDPFVGIFEFWSLTSDHLPCSKSSLAMLSEANNRWLGVLSRHKSNKITAWCSDNSSSDSLCLYLNSCGFDAKDFMWRRVPSDAQRGLMEYRCPCGLHACTCFHCGWQKWRGKCNGWGIPDLTKRLWVYGQTWSFKETGR